MEKTPRKKRRKKPDSRKKRKTWCRDRHSMPGIRGSNTCLGLLEEEIHQITQWLLEARWEINKMLLCEKKLVNNRLAITEWTSICRKVPTTKNLKLYSHLQSSKLILYQLQRASQLRVSLQVNNLHQQV